jgi:hypothetical protein
VRVWSGLVSFSSDFCASTVVWFSGCSGKKLKNSKISVLLVYLKSMEVNDWVAEELNPPDQEGKDHEDPDPPIHDEVAVAPVPWSVCKTKRGAFQVCTDGRRYQIKKSTRRSVHVDEDLVVADDGDDEDDRVDEEELLHHLTCASSKCNARANITQKLTDEDAKSEDFHGFCLVQNALAHASTCASSPQLLHEIAFRDYVLKGAIRDSAFFLREVYNSGITQVPEEFQALMPSLNSFNTGFYARRTGPLLNPQTHSELADEDVPNSAKFDSHEVLDGAVQFFQGIFHFLVGTVSHTIMAFFTDDFLMKLCRASKVLVDGTFKAMPLCFSYEGGASLFTLHFFVGEVPFRRCVPAAYFLCSTKSVEVYEAIITVLRNATERINLANATIVGYVPFQFAPVVLMCDFEAAVHAAFRRMSPETAITGCWFHYCHAIYVYMSNMGGGLKAEYHNPHFNQPALKTVVQALFALPFLPVANVISTYDALVVFAQPLVVAVPRVAPFLAYYKSRWLGISQTRPTGDMQRITSCNLYLNDDQNRTNNDVEGWHRVHNEDLLGGKNLWKFIRILQNHQCEQRNRVAQALAGTRISRIQSSRQRKKEESLLEIKQHYARGLYATDLDFILALGRFCWSV